MHFCAREAPTQVDGCGRNAGIQLILVLALSLGQSAIYSLVQLADKLSRGPLVGQSTAMNQAQSSREVFDLIYRLLEIGFALVPVALAWYFLSLRGIGARRLGLQVRFTARWWLSTVLYGLGLFVLIGAGTLGVYALGRTLGITTAIIPSGAATYWWSVPVLLLAAIQNAVVEEFVMIGFFFACTRALSWPPWLAILVSALIRGAYHTYQGIGPALGNVVMGVIFGWFYQRTGRLWPLILAHALLDATAFVGSSLAARFLGFGA